MKYSTALTSVTLALVGTACGGFTEVGQAGGDSGGKGGTTAADQGGTKASGGIPAAGGVAAGQGGDQGTANASSTGGSAGGGANQCKTANDCPTIGAPCQQCADGTFACPEMECRQGACVGSFPTCPTQVCQVDAECPKSLAPCELCDDGSSACPWARCENGTCTSGIDRCPTTGSCKLDTDCPGVELCAPCANGNCAEQKCLNGACHLTCDAGGGGTCSAERASCANGEACCAGLECCAGVPVPVGNEYCGKICPKSDVNIKRDFASVDPNEVLDKLSRLPVGAWSYRTEGSTVRHIGPLAQDFMATFGVGSSDRTILQVDADGVSFAAIQALNARLTAIEEQNKRLQRALDEQRERCEPTAR